MCPLHLGDKEQIISFLKNLGCLEDVCILITFSRSVVVLKAFPWAVFFGPHLPWTVVHNIVNIPVEISEWSRTVTSHSLYSLLRRWIGWWVFMWHRWFILCFFLIYLLYPFLKSVANTAENCEPDHSCWRISKRHYAYWNNSGLDRIYLTLYNTFKFWSCSTKLSQPLFRFYHLLT